MLAAATEKGTDWSRNIDSEMEGFLTDLGKTFAEKLINGVIEKSRYLFCFKCIANDFELEKKNLEAEWKTMRQRFEVAIEKGKDIQSNALFWEEQAKKLIEEDTKLKQRCFFGFCPDCIWRYKRGGELANKIDEIKELLLKADKLENVEITRSLLDVERYSSQSYISFKTRELKYQELLDALKDDSYYTIGLHGMGGTGKTTLAKEVGKQLKASMQFNRVIFTTVSNTPNIKKIQDDIAGHLELEWRAANESTRPTQLWDRLTNGEKILVILDDVWDYLNFEEIGIPNSDNHKGCKVLVTTRYRNVCNKMACAKTIQLELLSEEEAWDMFKIHAGLSNISSKDILDQGHKIAYECKRLPVAIATIASSLKGQNGREEWDVALTSLQRPMSMGDVDENLVDIYKCLKFSYDYLKDKKAMELFLLCSVFHEDEEISTEILTRLGIGVGLFGEDYEKYNDARNLVVVAKNKLLDSCLLLKSNKGDVKMHDLIREVAQWIANKEILAVNTSNKNQKLSLGRRDNNIKYLLFDGNPMDLCSSGFDGSKLKILILIMVTGCFVDSFFENIAGLRVLNLIAGKRITLSLPLSIRSLTNIRSLLVESANLGDISVLGSLQSLETLDLNQCIIDELPQEIAKLKELRLLNLKNCRVKRNNPFDVIQRCPSLEELYFLSSFNKFCKEITLPALERYQLTEYFGEMYYFSLSKCVYLLHDYLSEATFKHVIQTAQILKLGRIKKACRNLMPEIVPIDQGMNDLIELHLQYDSQLECLVDTKHIDFGEVRNVFSKLVVLELNEMNNLKELCNGPISSDFLNNLEKLSISECNDLGSLSICSLNLSNLKILRLTYCSTLVSVFDLSTSQSLLLLESLEMIYCVQLESIFTNERKSSLQVDGDNDNSKSWNSLFPKLKIVNIKRCHQLQFIFPLVSEKDLLLLEAIEIEDCDNLKHIFGKYQNVELASLKKLQLYDLPNFIGIFPKSNHSFEGSSHSIYKPQTELEVEPIKSNKFPWSHVCCYGYKLRNSSSTSTKIPIPSAYEDQPQHCSTSLESCCLLRLSHVMCNLKEINLWDIPRIKSVFTLSVAQKMLSLETLWIRYCNELEHMVVDIGDGSGTGVNIVFPKLKKLDVWNCKKLEYIFGHITASDHHHQTHLHLPALISLALWDLPSLIGLGTKNYHTILSHLTVITLDKCPQVDNKSIGDFAYSMSKSQDSTTIKDFSGNDLEAHLALEKLWATDSKFQYIFYLDEINGQQRNLGLKEIHLYDQHQMTYLFVGPRNCFSLQNLLLINIVQCKKLENIFSTCVLKCLPQLVDIKIEKCDELKYIVEDDSHMENKEISNHHMSLSRTCFPKLKSVVVIKCNKLNYLFPASMCTELPELGFLMIQEVCKLQKIFGSEENDQKVGIPNLRIVIFVELPSFFQGIQFQTVEHRLVHNCQKLSLTSTSTDVLSTLKDRSFSNKYEGDLIYYVRNVSDLIEEHSKTKDTSGGNLNGTEIQSTTSGNKNAIESNQYKIDSGLEIPSIENSQCLKESEDQSIEEGSTSETRNMQLVADLKQKDIKLSFEDVDHGGSQETTQTNNQGETAAAAATLSTIFETKNEPPIQTDVAPKQKGVEINVKEGTTSTNANTISPSTHLELVGSSPGPLVTSECNTSSQELMDQQSMDQKCLMNPQLSHSSEEIDATIKPSQENNLKLEGSTSEKTTAATISGSKNESPIQSDIAPKQKGTMISVEEGTASIHDINITSSTHPEDEDGKICIPSFSIVNTKPPAIKDVDIGDSQETIEMEDINKLIEEDPLTALEKLLTGVQSFSIGTLLQELKTLMDSSLDIDHLVSNQESKSKLISLFHGLNQHQRLLPSDVKEFVEKVQNFFNDNIIKHATYQQVLKKHNQLLDLKTDLMNKLRTAKSTQIHIDSETLTAIAKIHELSLQIEDLENQRDGLKSVVNKCDVQKMKLKAECTEWAQQSKELLSALASSEVEVREAERARNLTKEGFANLKSSFPTF